MTLRDIDVSVDGNHVDMTFDSTGHHGTVEMDGERFRVHVTLVRCGPPSHVRPSTI